MAMTMTDLEKQIKGFGFPEITNTIRKQIRNVMVERRASIEQVSYVVWYCFGFRSLDATPVYGVYQVSSYWLDAVKHFKKEESLKTQQRSALANIKEKPKRIIKQRKRESLNTQLDLQEVLSEFL